MILFCECGSDRIDVLRWDKSRALFKCFSCNQERWVEGFTIAEFDEVSYVWGAVLDQARKHRKRDPAILERLRARQREERKAAERR